VNAALDMALQRLEHCFGRIRRKYFHGGGGPVFNHLNTDQYAAFLYLLANTVYRADGDPGVASKLYALNKALHGLDVFYEVELPSVFMFQHPVGTVLGRAQYADYLLVYQRCSVGANLANTYPVIGPGVVMFGGSAVIGECRIAGNCWLSTGSLVMDATVPESSVVFGQSPALVMKPTARNVVRDIFGDA
jgi:serine O-acetyltransferase